MTIDMAVAVRGARDVPFSFRPRWADEWSKFLTFAPPRSGIQEVGLQTMRVTSRIKKMDEQRPRRVDSNVPCTWTPVNFWPQMLNIRLAIEHTE